MPTCHVGHGAAEALTGRTKARIGIPCVRDLPCRGPVSRLLTGKPSARCDGRALR